MDDNAAARDQNVFSFMMQLVQEKHGDDVDFQLLQDESELLYDIFGEELLKYFEPQLNEEQKQQFDQMIDQAVDQEYLLNFLITNIKDLESQIMQLLAKFRSDYIAGKLEVESKLSGK